MAVIGRLPTIPEYYQQYINSTVDLTTDYKQCCPFHTEDSPSWSYSAEKRRWRCFGACKTGGDVIDLHRMNYKLNSREEASKSLKAMYRVVDKLQLSKAFENAQINNTRVEDEQVYVTACLMANRPSRWLELDYIMSKYPPDILDLKALIESWEHPVI